MTTKPTKRAPDIITAMNNPKLFEPFFRGPTWDNWRTVLKASAALPLTDAERDFFRSVTDRSPPTKQVRTSAYICGRRAGKDSIASLKTAHKAAFFRSQHKLRPGERSLCVSIAPTRDQAQIQFGMIEAYFDRLPQLSSLIVGRTKESLELSNGVDIVTATASFKSIRGHSILCAVLSETAFMAADDAALPDTELYRALRPGLSTLSPESEIVLISSPHKKEGLLFDLYRDYFGRDSDDVLIVKAPTLTMNNNPALLADREQDFREDPDKARAEWDAEFRDDISALIGYDAVMRCVVHGRTELAPTPFDDYFCFIDGASGTVGGDSFTAAWSHKDFSGRSVLDCVREWKPPFNVLDCVHEVAEICRTVYRCDYATADRWSGDFLRQVCAEYNLPLEAAPMSKSEYYLATLPMIQAGPDRVALLQNERLIGQILNLERRVTRGTNREIVDHSAGTRDDLVNSALASLFTASKGGTRSKWGMIGA